MRRFHGATTLSITIRNHDAKHKNTQHNDKNMTLTLITLTDI